MKKKMEGGGLVLLGTEECTCIRGGISWENAEKILYYARMLLGFFLDYKNELLRGFRRGWDRY